ncbi:hypothetical protein NHX12_028973 [Muraenolepis orangiensis]|uniref:SH2 domain-containing protein n=1 Tax=Muraenolepis orangiensis TaxID=630683 RepID=A0A9Q0EGW1_9TELE|nr:hypothetical protein NHX12_028973 [Muraenolepis orangiensis]
MSFFEKLKNLHSGPPAPPRTIVVWPEDDFEEEEGDMYEVPPCERPAFKVPPKPMELDVYMDRSSDQVASQRQAVPPPRQGAPPPRQGAPPPRQGAPPPRQGAPPPSPQRRPTLPKRPAAPQLPPSARHAGAPTRATKLTAVGRALPSPQQEAEAFHDPSFKKPPEVDRKEKPGKKSAMKKMAPPPANSAPLPAPPSHTEEDVYIDPNEERRDDDDVYLEPTEASPPSSRGPMRLPSPFCPAGPPPARMSLVKPPVPRDMSNSLLASVSKMKAAAPDGKRDGKRVFPPPVKPQFLGSDKDSQTPNRTQRPLSPPLVDYSPEVTENEDDEWFAGDCKRKDAEGLLLSINKDGAFLIRHSSSQDTRQPYTLAVLYRQKVYNIPVRFVEGTQGYALGKEGRENEESFNSLQDIIFHHQKNQLLLVDSMSQAINKTYLVHPARP